MYKLVSTLLEILGGVEGYTWRRCHRQDVSTLLEILAGGAGVVKRDACQQFQPFLRFWTCRDGRSGSVGVSTLLEILGLMCSVVVGF